MGRYWRVGTDDLPLPFMCLVIGRTIWVALLSVALVNTNRHREQGGPCENGFVGTPLYLSLAIFFFVLSLLSGLRIMCVGMKGHIFDTEARAAMQWHLRAHIAIACMEGVCALFGLVVFMARYNFPCFDNQPTRGELTLIAAVVISQFVEFGSTMCCCCTAQSRRLGKGRLDQGKGEGGSERAWGTVTESEEDLPSRASNLLEPLTAAEAEQREEAADTAEEEEEEEEEAHDQLLDALQTWMRRLQRYINRVRCCFCSVLGGNHVVQEDLEGAAMTLAKFFHHDGFLDIVPGDVLAGLLLVRWLQRDGMRASLEINPIGESAKAAEGEAAEAQADAESAKIDGPRERRLSQGNSNKTHTLKVLLTEATGTDPDDSDSPRLSRGQFRMIGHDHIEGTLRSHLSARAKLHRREMDPASPEDRQVIEDISELMPYCLAMYTLFLAVIHPCTFSCRICLTGLQHSGKHKTDGDTTGIHKAAAMHHLRGEEQCELLYGNFGNVDASPYCIFKDKIKRRVVLALRGTMSVEDAVTDALCKTVELTDAGHRWGFDGKDKFAHKGFLKSADFIRQELESSGRIEQIYADLAAAGESDEEARYELCIVGHSLGAALATLVAVLLRAKYPAIKCFAFAAPACVDQAFAVECVDFVTSVVLGDDIVPSLNFYSLCHLRDRVLDALLRAKVNKSKILWRSNRMDFVEEEFLFRPEEVPDSSFRRQIEAFRVKVHSRLAEDPAPQCTLAGKIVHLVHPSKEWRSAGFCKKKKMFRAYESHWSSFLDVPVAKNGVRHHWPHLYNNELKYIRKAWGIDPKTNFS